MGVLGRTGVHTARRCRAGDERVVRGCHGLDGEGGREEEKQAEGREGGEEPGCGRGVGGQPGLERAEVTR